VRQRAEQRLVQEFIPQPSIEALDEGVLDRLARRDVMPGHPAVVRPAQDRIRGEFAAIVADHHPGLALLMDQPIQLPHDPQAGERGISHQAKAFAGAIVDDGQNAEAASVDELIRDKVQRPAVVGGKADRHRRSRPDRPLAAAAAANGQLLLPVEAEQPLVIDHIALPPQKNMKPAIAEPAPLVRHRFHPLAQDAVIRARRRVANRHPAAVDHLARPPLAHLEG
jgi:hypothetical protein